MKFINSKIDIEVCGDKNDGMTDEEFFNFCVENRDLLIERDANRQIYIMAPTGFETGNFNADITTDLTIWSRKNKSGRVFDSSTGFTLPDRAVFSPYSAWVCNDRILKLQRNKKSICVGLSKFCNRT